MNSETLEARRKYHRERMRQWRQKPENRVKENLRKKKYRQQNPEKIEQHSLNFYARLAKEDN
ncbi:hypothetical protein P9661_16085 [Bacillus subtilis]|nr:hypothetical protein [Bacillus subtilis]